MIILLYLTEQPNLSERLMVGRDATSPLLKDAWELRVVQLSFVQPVGCNNPWVGV